MDDSGCIPFDLTEDDYEGLIEDDDGEFYYKQRKKKRKLSKDKQILGVFAEENSEEEEEDIEAAYERYKKIAKGMKGKSGFTSAGVQDASKLNNTVGTTEVAAETQKEKEERRKNNVYTIDDSVSDSSDLSQRRRKKKKKLKKKRKAGEKSSSDEEDKKKESNNEPASSSRFAPMMDAEDMNKTISPAQSPSASPGTNSDSDSSIDSRFKFKAKDSGRMHGPHLEKKVDMAQGELKQKYGIGYKLLQKQGWKGGGLGSKETGIANPVEATVRGKKQGITVNDVSKNANKNLDGFVQQKSLSAIEMLLGNESSRQGEKVKREVKKQADGWKKDAKPKPKRQEYTTAKELRKALPKTYIIRDMTGPQERVLTTLEGAFGFSESKVEFEHMRELKYNVRRLVEQCETKLELLEKDMKQHERMVQSLEDEIDGRVPRKPKVHSEDLKHVLDTLEDCKRKKDFHFAVDAVEGLRKSFPLAMDGEEVREICLSVLAPMAKKRIERINGGILDSQTCALEILTSVEQALCCADDSAWPAFIGDVIVDKLRKELTSWNVRELSAIEFFDKMAKVLPEPIVQEVIEKSVVPRLQVEIEKWNVSNEATAHTWTHPWIAHIPLESLRQVFDTVYHRLSRWLSCWNYNNPKSILERIRPWKQVLLDREWAGVLLKLRKRLMEMSDLSIRRISPENSPVEMAEALFELVECFPELDLTEVLEEKLFKPWLKTLRVWLDDEDCDHKEILAWLKAWRSSILKSVLDLPYFEDLFAYAFKLMKHHLTNGKEPMPSPRQYKPPRPKSRSPPTDRAERLIPRGEEVDMNIKDVLEEIAGEEDFLMVPTKHKSSLTNKQLYYFGKATVFWEANNVVYCQTKDGKFVPLVLDELVKVAKGLRAP